MTGTMLTTFSSQLPSGSDWIVPPGHAEQPVLALT